LQIKENEHKQYEWKLTKEKIESEIQILRNERVALEEVIRSLRNECDTLRSSLNKEFEMNDHFKTQVSRFNKDKKDYQEVYYLFNFVKIFVFFLILKC